MPHQSARLHLAEHGGHRRVGQVAFVAERGVHVGHGRLAAFPQHFHYFQLEIAEALHFGFDRAHVNDCGNTTTVVDKVNPMVA